MYDIKYFIPNLYTFLISTKWGREQSTGHGEQD